MSKSVRKPDKRGCSDFRLRVKGEDLYSNSTNQQVLVSTKKRYERFANKAHGAQEPECPDRSGHEDSEYRATQLSNCAAAFSFSNSRNPCRDSDTVSPGSGGAFR